MSGNFIIVIHLVENNTVQRNTFVIFQINFKMESFSNLTLTIENQNYSLMNMSMMNMSNLTREDLDYEQVKMVVELFNSDNRVLSDPAYTAIIVIYTVLVTVAGCGNSAVMFAVMRRKEMRTARNIFIFNLALSDLLMATSIPFTVMDGLTRAWNLPESLMACRYGSTSAEYLL